MSEEQVVENVEETGLDDLNVEEPSYINPEEDMARNQGWVDLEEWVDQGKPEKDWVNATVFNMKGELFKKISTLRKEVDTYRDAIAELKNHNAKLAAEQTKKLKQQLKAQKVKAVEEGNGKVVAEIDEWLDELNQPQQAQQPEQQDGVDSNILQQTFNEWLTHNSWYTEDNELRETADTLGIAEAFKITKNQRALTRDEIEDVYAKVSKLVKKQFPEKFGNPNRSKGSPVASSNSGTRPKSGAAKKNYTIKDIPDEYQAIARKFERSGALSVNEYAQQLKSMGVL